MSSSGKEDQTEQNVKFQIDEQTYRKISRPIEKKRISFRAKTQLIRLY